MKIKIVIKLVKSKLKGTLRCAVEEGMIVGKGVTVMSGVNFGSEPYLITLGDRVRISSDVIFVNHDGGTWAFKGKYEEYDNVTKFGKINVGAGTFIGCKSVIMPGVTIGKNCVIGAGSIVTKDVPDETVVCGVPAKKVCTLAEYAANCKKQMPEDFDIQKYNENKKQYLIDTLK